MCLFKQTYPCFRPLSLSNAVLDQLYIFLPAHLPFGDAFCFLPSLSYDLLPLQNLAAHNLVSQRQSVVVLTVKMVDYICIKVANVNYYQYEIRDMISDMLELQSRYHINRVLTNIKRPIHSLSNVNSACIASSDTAFSDLFGHR